MGLIIDMNQCIFCETCIESCPLGALSLYDEIVWDEKNCIFCGICEDNCPVQAITLEKKTL